MSEDNNMSVTDIFNIAYKSVFTSVVKKKPKQNYASIQHLHMFWKRCDK